MKRAEFLLATMLIAAQAAARGQTPRPPFQHDERVVVELSAPRRVQLGDAIPVTFKMTNRSEERLQVVSWGTPLSGWRADMFVVRLDGEPLWYHGVMARHGKVSPAAYVELDPGASVSAVLDFAAPRTYGIDKTGRLTIAFRNRLIDVFAGDRRSLHGRAERTQSVVEGNTVEILIEAREPRAGRAYRRWVRPPEASSPLWLPVPAPVPSGPAG